MSRTLLLLFLLAMSTSSWAKSPRRAMILVFDQMRAEYIERFELPNFRRAQAMGVTFDNGFVGHLEANTIISHPVVTTGKLPRNLPWSAQIMHDIHGWLGEKGEFYVPSDLRTDQWLRLFRMTAGDSSLVARVVEEHPGPSFAVAQKKYSAYCFGGPYADTIIALGPAIKDGEYRGRHSISGENVPPYIASPLGNRFYLEATNRWGSEKEGYGLTGSGYVTGTDPERPGGDAWVGDAVEQIMEQEPEWAVILASFGAIDKVSHVLAEHDGPSEAVWAKTHGIGLEDTLRKADRELGRLLDRLEQNGLLAETALVITADHGGQYSRQFHGRRVPGEHEDDGNYGKGSGFDYTQNVNPNMVPLVSSGKLLAASVDTMASFWTLPMSSSERKNFVLLLSQLPGVCEVYEKKPDGNYGRLFRSPELKGRELAWAQLHNDDLVDSMGGAAGPNYVTPFFDNHGYAIIGGHGGAQELGQRIPMIVISPNLTKTGAHSEAWVRLVDINPMVGRLLNLRPHPGLDGTDSAILPFLDRGAR